MPPMTMPMMVGFMILFMAGFMILFMIVVHFIRSHFNKQHGTSAHDLHSVMPVIPTARATGCAISARQAKES